MNDEEEEASGMQREWESIHHAVRVELRNLIPLISSMQPEELKIFIETLESARWSEFNAALFDKKLSLEMSKVTAD